MNPPDVSMIPKGSLSNLTIVKLVPYDDAESDISFGLSSSEEKSVRKAAIEEMDSLSQNSNENQEEKEETSGQEQKSFTGEGLHKPHDETYENSIMEGQNEIADLSQLEAGRDEHEEKSDSKDHIPELEGGAKKSVKISDENKDESYNKDRFGEKEKPSQKETAELPQHDGGSEKSDKHQFDEKEKSSKEKGMDVPVDGDKIFANEVQLEKAELPQNNDEESSSKDEDEPSSADVVGEKENILDDMVSIDLTGSDENINISRSSNNLSKLIENTSMMVSHVINIAKACEQQGGAEHLGALVKQLNKSTDALRSNDRSLQELAQNSKRLSIRIEPSQESKYEELKKEFDNYKKEMEKQIKERDDRIKAKDETIEQLENMMQVVLNSASAYSDWRLKQDRKTLEKEA